MSQQNKVVVTCALTGLLTERLASQLLISGGAALLAVGLGYGGATVVIPGIGSGLGIQALSGSLHTAGSMALASGVLFVLARLAAGRRHRRHQRHAAPATQ